MNFLEMFKDVATTPKLTNSAKKTFANKLMADRHNFAKNVNKNIELMKKGLTHGSMFTRNAGEVIVTFKNVTTPLELKPGHIRWILLNQEAAINFLEKGIEAANKGEFDAELTATTRKEKPKSEDEKNIIDGLKLKS